MTHENVEIVRSPLRVRGRSRRTLDQRLAIRCPRLGTASVRLIGKLPPSSRLRQAAVIRIQEYFDHADALEAVGLQE